MRQSAKPLRHLILRSLWGISTANPSSISNHKFKKSKRLNDEIYLKNCLGFDWGTNKSNGEPVIRVSVKLRQHFIASKVRVGQFNRQSRSLGGKFIYGIELEKNSWGIII